MEDQRRLIHTISVVAVSHVPGKVNLGFQAQKVLFSFQVLNDLELAGQAILVKVGKKEQPSLEAFLSPKDEEAAKKHQSLLDTVKAKVKILLEYIGFISTMVPCRLLPTASTGLLFGREGIDGCRSVFGLLPQALASPLRPISDKDVCSIVKC